MGVNDIRIAVPWAYMRPQDNKNYDWAKMDYVVHAASERGMNIVGVISGTPTCAGFPLNGHSDPADCARFAAAVAARYDDTSTIGAIDDYEIWNEPNGALFYNPADAKAYTRMLQAAYPAIKANNPDAVVIAGVLRGEVPEHRGRTCHAADGESRCCAARPQASRTLCRG